MCPPMKKIFVQAQLLYDKDSNEKLKSVKLTPVKEISFAGNLSSAEVKSVLRKSFAVEDDAVVLKLRNHRNSLIIISCKISINTPKMPYVLEITKQHQTVRAKPRSVTKKEHMETLQRVLKDYIDRLDTVAAEIPNLKDRREYLINKDVQEMTTKLEFLNKRLGIAFDSDWQGMFKKNPLW